jgi:hypothetical protein
MPKPKFEDSQAYGLQELKKKITEDVAVYQIMQLEGSTEDEIKNAKMPLSVVDEKTKKTIQVYVTLEKFAENLGLQTIYLDDGMVALVKSLKETAPILGALNFKHPGTNLPIIIHGEASNQIKTQELQSILPQKHVKPNNKLANEITKDFINEGEISLNVGRRGSKREIITKAMLSYQDEKISLSGRIAFTPYDREVHDGVVTLYVAGNEVITPEMVYRAMNGMTET